MKLPPQEKWFQYILGFSALFIAAIAGFFSIMGIGLLFSGAAISAMVMATSLEIGKVVGISFLYRYWNKTTKFLRVYLAAAILLLVAITSLGVFGWLSSAYQSSSLQYEMSQQQVATLTVQKNSIGSQLELSKNRIESLSKIRNDQEVRMNEALNSPILSRNPTALRQVQDQNVSLIKQTDDDIKESTLTYNKFVGESMEMDKKIFTIKSDTGKTKDIITFKFVSEAFGLELNSTVKWFIILIIIVFDPLAVCLILAYNVILSSEEEKSTVIPPKEKLLEPKIEPSVVVPPIEITEDKIEVFQPEERCEISPVPKSDNTSGLRESEIFHRPTPHSTSR